MLFYLIELHYRNQSDNIILNLMEGIKRKRRCKYQCQEHLFSLKNMKNNSKFDIKLTFCPNYQRQPLPPQHTFAEYNNDYLFYTSAFVLGIDKKYLAKNHQKELLEHQKLIKQHCERYNQIAFPRPNSKHATCSVCKSVYKNYYHHIFSDQHSQRIQQSLYNTFLKQLCERFKPLWDGCAQIADEEEQNFSEAEASFISKRVSSQVDIDEILQEEEIQLNPQNISDYLEKENGSQQLTMKKVEKIQNQLALQPQKLYESRQSRKKNINFAAFFEDEPKKKIMNDRREGVNANQKKAIKKQPANETTYKQKIEKKDEFQNTDPFIIEYNARTKRKQKKSYYYIKKKEREERQQREKQLLVKQQTEQGIAQQKQKNDEAQQKNSQKNQLQNSQDIKRQSLSEDEFIENESQGYILQTDLNKVEPKKVTYQVNLFEQVQKKPLSTSLINSFGTPIKTQQRISLFNPNLKDGETHSSQKKSISLDDLLSKKSIDKDSRSFTVGKNITLQQQQKQSIIDKNQIINSYQNDLLVFHKFKNPLQKQTTKQNDIKIQKPFYQVFNEYQQKIRQYQKQKDYNVKLKIQQKLTLSEQKVNQNRIENIQENNTKIYKNYRSRDFQQTHRFQIEKNIPQISNSSTIVKNEYGSAKYNNFIENFYKNQPTTKELTVPPSHQPSSAPYSNIHPFYQPYNYPYSSFGYQMQQSKAGQTNLKYNEQRDNEAYQRGFYNGGWQQHYYMPLPPGTIVSPSSNHEMPRSQTGQANFGNSQFNGKTNQSKSVAYPGFSNYPLVNYPGYYHPTGTQYSPTQRQQYSHTPSNMRLQSQPPNTNININFPMYLGTPSYPSPYQYQNNISQRYPTHQQQTSQYISQAKPSGGQPNSEYNSSGLVTFAEYQEYKKRRQ